MFEQGERYFLCAVKFALSRLLTLLEMEGTLNSNRRKSIIYYSYASKLNVNILQNLTSYNTKFKSLQFCLTYCTVPSLFPNLHFIFLKFDEEPNEIFWSTNLSFRELDLRLCSMIASDGKCASPLLCHATNFKWICLQKNKDFVLEYVKGRSTWYFNIKNCVWGLFC